MGAAATTADHTAAWRGMAGRGVVGDAGRSRARSYMGWIRTVGLRGWGVEGSGWAAGEAAHCWGVEGRGGDRAGHQDSLLSEQVWKRRRDTAEPGTRVGAAWGCRDGLEGGAGWAD